MFIEDDQLKNHEMKVVLDMNGTDKTFRVLYAWVMSLQKAEKEIFDVDILLTKSQPISFPQAVSFVQKCMQSSLPSYSITHLLSGQNLLMTSRRTTPYNMKENK